MSSSNAVLLQPEDLTSLTSCHPTRRLLERRSDRSTCQWAASEILQRHAVTHGRAGLERIQRWNNVRLQTHEVPALQGTRAAQSFLQSLG